MGQCRKSKGWGVREGFLYRIYTRKIRIWGCDMVRRKKYVYLYARKCKVVIRFETVKDIYLYIMCHNIVKQIR